MWWLSRARGACVMLCLAMAAAYSSEPWHDLFVGVSGAAAVLTGLLFVSLSINLEQILGQVWLPRRAALTLMLLFEALVSVHGAAASDRPTRADRGERGGGAAGDAVLTSAAQRTPLVETEDGELLFQGRP